MGKKTNFNTGTYKIAKGLRNTDPMIKIPIVSPEDSENSVNPDGVDGGNVKTQEDESFREQPSPQVPTRRRRKSDRGSVTSSSSSSSGSNSIAVTSPSRKKSSVTSVEISLSPTRSTVVAQRSRRLTPPSSSKSASKYSHSDHMLPLPPPPPPPPTSDFLDSETIREELRRMGKFPITIEDLPPPPSPPKEPEQRYVCKAGVDVSATTIYAHNHPCSFKFIDHQKYSVFF